VATLAAVAEFRAAIGFSAFSLLTGSALTNAAPGCPGPPQRHNQTLSVNKGIALNRADPA
jgi:hypothetical protein